MAPLPKPMSLTASAIEAAIAEGRTLEAMHKLAHALRQRPDDRAVRHLAADWIENIGLPGGAAKSLRKGRPALKEDWLEISEMVTNLQGDGRTYADAVAEAAAHFNCSERHVQVCVADWNRASQARWDEE